jgi:release factor H-coupled RctB family protein
MTNIHSMVGNAHLIASADSWIEGDAVRQLNTTSGLPGIELGVGFPDLHPGKGFPVGAAFVSRDVVYPALAGNDIGCAMSFWRTSLPARKLKLERWASRLEGLDMPYEGDRELHLAAFELEPGPHDAGLGTIGGGNHFAELQRIDTVFDAERLSAASIEKGDCGLLVHSGSRGLGQAVASAHLTEHGASGLEAGSEALEVYMARHQHARQWARCSRALIARRFAAQIGFDVSLVSDVEHNMLSLEDWRGGPAWIHRKGAAAARGGLVMVPGSRGTLSYLVAPAAELDDAAWSIAHGAGRRWQRGYAKSRLSHKYRVPDLQRNQFGGHIVCEDRTLLYDEAPQAYKNVDQVVRDLEAAGLVRKVASLQPLISFKCRRQDDD